MIKHAKRMITLFLVIVLMVTQIPVSSVQSAENKSQSIYKEAGLEVTFKVNSKWENGFEGQFIITNQSDKPLENWRLKFKFDHEIASLWDGEIESHKGMEYVLKHPSWNPNIAVGGKAVIGFNGKGTGEIKAPYDCSIPNAKSEAAKEDYAITYRVSSDWKDAFNGEISITNQTKQAIEGWSLEFDFRCQISNFWTAKVIRQDGDHYVIKNDDWNSVIKPGETVKLGFEAKPGNTGAEPTNYKLTKSQLEDTGDADAEDSDFFDPDDLTEEELMRDTDKDGIPDVVETQFSKTDPKNADTDGDGLPDGYELFEIGTDPLAADSDRDEDEDGLTNLEEYKLGTNAEEKDTDYDGILDYDEINKYHTDPLKQDTDGDTIYDGDEILLGFDPLKKDTDGNGILDCDEKVQQTFSQDFDKEDSSIIRSVTLEGACSKKLDRTTEIDNYYNVDVQTTDVEGLIGIPVNIETESGFDKMDVIFNYGVLPSAIKEENIGVLWYNEKEESYELQDCVLDAAKNTVRFSTNHFSTYMLVDKVHWNKIWNTPIVYGNPKHAKEFTSIAYVVDFTKSMNDTKLPEIRTALKQLINTMASAEKGSVIGYKL